MQQNRKLILKNSLKAFFLLIVGILIFIIIITIFPLLGSLWLPDFPIGRVIKENFTVFVPLSFFSLLVSPVLGFATIRYRNKRKLKLTITGVLAYWLAVFFILLVFSDFKLLNENLFNVFVLTFWGIMAYSFFSLPVLIPIILIFEKWTRPEIEIK